MAFANEESTTWTQKCRHHLGPQTHVGEPAQCADARIHEVEPTGSEHVDRAVQFALDVVDCGVTLASEPGCRLECGRREVEPRDTARTSRARDSVSVPMWHWRCTTSSPAMSEPREIESHDVRQVIGVGAKPFETVPHHMMWDSAIPMRAVQLNIVIHPGHCPTHRPCSRSAPAVASRRDRGS